MNTTRTSLLSLLFLSFLLLSEIASADDLPLGAPVVESVASMVKSPVDPWERYNRSIFRFNEKADRALIKPLAKAYVRLTPAFFRQGVDNVLSNVLEVPSVFNGVLQGNFRGATHDTGRLLLNSTLGLAGIVDVAQHMNLKRNDHEDFGQTLAVWGINDGPYMILPFLGPSNLRDTAAIPVDWVIDPTSYIDHVATKNTARVMSLLNVRVNIMPLEKSITGDKYVFLREAYLQRRNFLVNNGVVEDSFGEEGAE